MWNGYGIPRCDSGNHEQPLSGEHDARAAAPSADGSRPGPGGDGFYAGYFRDPDGNKLNAFCMK